MFNDLTETHDWKYGGIRRRELSEIRRAQSSGLEREYMACQFHVRAHGLVPYDDEQGRRTA